MMFRNRPFLSFLIPFLAGVLCTFVAVWIWADFSGTASSAPPNPAMPRNSMPFDGPEGQEPEDEGTESMVESSPQEQPVALIPAMSGDLSNPIPLEWEKPLFAVLDQTNPVLRKQGLINMALNSAVHVPRIQAECVLHLAYSLSEEDYPQFLLIIRNPVLPTSIRSDFLARCLKTRRGEFAAWLAKSLVNDPQPEISSVALAYLNSNQKPY